jgi:hypothetical protein
MSNREMTTIHVFPNSGHHYFFLPLEKDLLSTYPLLKQMCDRGKEPWFQAGRLAWVRCRLGTKDRVPGLWVAVESNVGTIRRGTIYEPRRQSDAPCDTTNPSPYAVTSVTRLSDEATRVPIKMKLPAPRAAAASGDAPAEGPPASATVEVATFDLVWVKANAEPIDVDIIIDFGNTRSVVLALEVREAQNGNLAAVCRPVRFTKRGCDYEAFPARNREVDSSAIVDSWFVLQEPVFAMLEPPSPSFKPALETETEQRQIDNGIFRGPKTEQLYFVTARIPQMFVELSPCVMGDAARDILSSIDLQQGGNYSLSSPKRYTWDSDPVGKGGTEFWTMALNRWNPNAQKKGQPRNLAGSMLRFLPVNGCDWTIDEPPNEAPDIAQRPSGNPEQPSYPRSDAMTWSALSILELAYRQVTSEEWRKGDSPNVPRRIRDVMVTFPSGWSTEESSAYRRKWQKAIDIFTLAHMENKRSIYQGGNRPNLLMEIDEAVASQLPFVYSEIRSLGNRGHNWISLFGRGKGTDARMRIMTVDIGGGTTDISIVEYRDGLEHEGVELNVELLFRDSSSIAGDALTKTIIQSVLLPSLGRRFQEDDVQAETFANLFTAPHQRTGRHGAMESKAKWSRIVKLVFLPIVRQWLKDLSQNVYGNPETGGNPWSADRIMGPEGRMVDPIALSDLNEFALESPLDSEILADSDEIPYDPAAIEKCIRDTFTPVIRSLAKYVTAFEVDLVTLSGKPSELPQVKKMLEEKLPILPHRIIQAKDYPAGDWYPMTFNGRINDAKSVTAVGAALYKTIFSGQIQNWRIHWKNSTGFLAENYWGVMPSEGQSTTSWKAFLEPGKQETITRMMVGQCIGRKLIRSAAKPEQVYRLRWSKPEDFAGLPQTPVVSITLRRVIGAEGETEKLLLTNASGQTGNQHLGTKEITHRDLELQPCTMDGGEEFWIDTGRFTEVLWPDFN